MFKDNQFSRLRIEMIKNKMVYIVDRHQYTLPIWAYYSLKNKQAYELVSIDYHPDTQPPFWQKMQLKAINMNVDDVDGKVEELIDARLYKVDRENAVQLIEEAHELNNDEHIHTAIHLKYLTTYHMLNCMDAHDFPEGKHYLIDEKFFGSLEDFMFESVGFECPNKPMILDIDLDYFLDQSFDSPESLDIFTKLVKRAEIITVARSVKYFEYLKREAFSIEECEEKLLKLIGTLV